MADQPPPMPSSRHQIRAGIIQETGEPFIEIVDNLAVQSMQLDLPTALMVAAGITQHAAQLLAMAHQQAEQRKRGIVVATPNDQSLKAV